MATSKKKDDLDNQAEGNQEAMHVLSDGKEVKQQSKPRLVTNLFDGPEKVTGDDNLVYCPAPVRTHITDTISTPSVYTIEQIFTKQNESRREKGYETVTDIVHIQDKHIEKPNELSLFCNTLFYQEESLESNSSYPRNAVVDLNTLPELNYRTKPEQETGKPNPMELVVRHYNIDYMIYMTNSYNTASTELFSNDYEPPDLL